MPRLHTLLLISIKIEPFPKTLFLTKNNSDTVLQFFHPHLQT